MSHTNEKVNSNLRDMKYTLLSQLLPFSEVIKNWQSFTHKCLKCNFFGMAITAVSILQYYQPILTYCIHLYRCIRSELCTDIKSVFKARINAWTSDLKWCNYAACPAEGSPLLNNY